MRVKKIPFTAQRVCDRVWGYLELIKGHKSLGPRVWAAAPGVADFLNLKFCPCNFLHYFRCNCNNKKKKKVIVVRWFPPDPGVIKINTDGASKGNPGGSAVGGLLEIIRL
ncbi:hypothetical protein OROHE_021240 [Orobanche hederae]